MKANSIESAVAAAYECRNSFARLSRFKRSQLLSAISLGIESHRSALVEKIIQEAGKPRSLAEAEVSRGVGTFQIAAEEAKRYGGELLPIDFDESQKKFKEAVCLMRPRGVVFGITPFNFPLNLVAHKVAPALAIGSPILLKPPPQAPGASEILLQIFKDVVARLSDKEEPIPLAAFQIVTGSHEEMEKVIRDLRIGIFSFTGSDKAGWQLRNLAERKKVVLELGGNAAVVIDETADLKRAAERCAYGAFAYAGQICISVQRIFVAEKIRATFEKEMITETGKIIVGDPNDAQTLVGPMINAEAALKIEKQILEAVRNGAQILFPTSGKIEKKDDRTLMPHLLTKVSEDSPLVKEEAFAPIVVLESYSKEESLIQKVNASKFGLQAGIFSNSHSFIERMKVEIEAGGIVINEIPTFRSDAMPYGGVKDSGMGREGVRFAMQEMSEFKTIVEFRSH